MMDEAAKRARREYYRKYRQENKDKIKQYNDAYWARKASLKENEKEQKAGE